MEVVKGLCGKAGGVLGCFLFNRLLCDLEKEIQLCLIKFTNDAKICEPVFTLEERADIQGDLERLQERGGWNPS